LVEGSGDEPPWWLDERGALWRCLPKQHPQARMHALWRALLQLEPAPWSADEEGGEPLRDPTTAQQRSAWVPQLEVRAWGAWSQGGGTSQTPPLALLGNPGASPSAWGEAGWGWNLQASWSFDASPQEQPRRRVQALRRAQDQRSAERLRLHQQRHHLLASGAWTGAPHELALAFEELGARLEAMGATGLVRWDDLERAASATPEEAGATLTHRGPLPQGDNP
jgi:hypothetical protein